MVKRILIPNGSVVQLEMSILNGGHNDPSQGWTDNCASKSESGSIYLRVEYAVIKGPYANVKFRSSIGLKSPKGPWWRKRGREFIIQLLNYKHNLSASDLSINARQMRRLKNFADLNGTRFTAKIKNSRDHNDTIVNEIDEIVLPETINNEANPIGLRQRDLTQKLTSAETGPMWLVD